MANQNNYQQGYQDFITRYDAELAAPGAVADDVAKKFANESGEYFAVAQKRAYDEALLQGAHAAYYGDGTPANPGRKADLDGKDPATLPPADQLLLKMVNDYGLTPNLADRANNLPVDLHDYPEAVRDGYVSQMNALLSSYVANHQPMTADDLTKAADMAEGRTQSMNGDNTIENNSADLLKESEEMKAWVDLYYKEGKAGEPPYESPYAGIVSVERKGEEPNSPVHMKLETGSTLVNTGKSLHMFHEKGGPTLEECMTMVRMGQKKGWTSARLTGTKEFQEQMYLACRALNMPVKDYEPTPELKFKADKMMADMPSPSHSERAADLDARTQGGNYTPPQQNGPVPNTPDPVEVTALKTAFDSVDKLAGDGMDALAAAEKTKVAAALKHANAEQRKAWRSELKNVEAKEAKGEVLTPQELAVKAKAAQYQVMTDPKLEPKNPPQVKAKDMDPAVKKAYNAEKNMAKADTLLSAAVMQELCAKTKDGYVEGRLDMSVPVQLKDLIAETQKVTADKKAGLPKGIAQVMQEAGKTAAGAKNIFAQAAVKYQQKTNEAPVQTQTLSKNAQKLDARLATLVQRQGRP